MAGLIDKGGLHGFCSSTITEVIKSTYKFRSGTFLPTPLLLKPPNPHVIAGHAAAVDNLDCTTAYSLPWHSPLATAWGDRAIMHLPPCAITRLEDAELVTAAPVVYTCPAGPPHIVGPLGG